MTLDQAALANVIAHGTPLERWRAERLLGFAGPLPPGWDSRQNPEGGWQSRETTSPLSNTGFTSMMLMRMAFTGLTDTPQWQRTVDFFWRTQQPDGRWTENRGQLEAGLPEWNQPGDLETELWETANTAAVLGACGYAGDPRVARALAYVLAHGRPDGTFPGYLHTTYAMAAAMHTRGAAAERDRYLQAAGRFLDQHGQAEWFDIMDVTWALILWAIAGIPGVDHTVERYRLHGMEQVYFRRLALQNFVAAGWQVKAGFSAHAKVAPTPKSDLIPKATVDGFPVAPSEFEFCVLDAT